jgi:hypothetical protein
MIMIIKNIDNNTEVELKYVYGGIDCTNDIIGNTGAIKLDKSAVDEGLIWFDIETESYYANQDTIDWWMDYLYKKAEIDDRERMLRDNGVTWEEIHRAYDEQGGFNDYDDEYPIADRTLREYFNG